MLASFRQLNSGTNTKHPPALRFHADKAARGIPDRQPRPEQLGQLRAQLPCSEVDTLDARASNSAGASSASSHDIDIVYARLLPVALSVTPTTSPLALTTSRTVELPDSPAGTGAPEPVLLRGREPVRVGSSDASASELLDFLFIATA